MSSSIPASCPWPPVVNEKVSLEFAGLLLGVGCGHVSRNSRPDSSPPHFRARAAHFHFFHQLFGTFVVGLMAACTLAASATLLPLKPDLRCLRISEINRRPGSAAIPVRRRQHVRFLRRPAVREAHFLILAFSSIFFISALHFPPRPWPTTISCSFLVGSFFTVARLFCCT